MGFGMDYDILLPVEKELVVLALGVDTLTGGDALHESGMYHMIIDTWTSGMKPPQVYYHETAVALRGTDGVDGFADKAAVENYITEFRLRELPGKIRAKIDQLNPNRQKFVGTLVDTLEVILNTVDVTTPEPSYDDKYRVVTGINVVEPIDAEVYREAMGTALKAAGFDPAKNGGIREAYLAWEHNQGFIGQTGVKPEGMPIIDGEVVKQRFTEIIQTLLTAAREHLFPKIGFDLPGYKPDLSDVEFGGFEFKSLSNVPFTGSSIYRGQGPTAEPQLLGLLEYNTDHPMTPSEIINLASHEAMLGHYFNSAVADLHWRAGRLPVEATMGTMCTSSTAYQEGWAENALFIAYGGIEEAFSGVEKDFGVRREDLAVVIAQADLQNVAKHNVALLHQRNGMPIKSETEYDLRTYLVEECLLPDYLVNKLSGSWAQHKLVGPLYGPAYFVGTDVVRTALKQVGALKVAQVGLQTTGRMANLDTFKEQVYK